MRRPPSQCCFPWEEVRTQGSKDARTESLLGFLFSVSPPYPTPVFFVSVASKGLSQAVSLLFATLARRPISVASKGLKARVGSCIREGKKVMMQGGEEKNWKCARGSGTERTDSARRAECSG